MTTSTELDRLIVKDEAQRKAAIARAAERGGLPTFQDIDDLEGDLREVHKALEEFAMDAEAVAGFEGEGTDVPFPVTAEHIATLGLVVERVDYDLELFRVLIDRIRGQLLAIDGVRREQAEAA